MSTKIQAGEAVTLSIEGAELTINASLITSMLLERLQASSRTTTTSALHQKGIVPIGSRTILRGMIYAGIARGMDSERDYHLWLIEQKPEKDMPWADAMKWAEDLGEHASLPTRHEQALLYANLKDQFDAEAYWSNTQYAGGVAYAWCQSFGNGGQSHDHKGYKLRVRAVRRLPIE